MVREITNAVLAARNSFGVEAFARRIVEFDDAGSLRSYLAEGNPLAQQSKTAVIGGGNNILFTKDFDGTLLHPVSDSFSVAEEDDVSATIRAGAGMDWDRFVENCIACGLWGAENLSAIPGTVGAAPVQNIGAYGAEAKDIIDRVEILDLYTLKETTLSGKHCDFSYRNSIFKGVLRDRAVITSVWFRLSKIPQPNISYGALAAKVGELGGASLENIRQAVIDIRRDKLPDPSVLGNAGSFFKNPLVAKETAEELKKRYPDMPVYPADGDSVKISAGWLIEQAGWKGKSRGKAGVYHRQALILVNHGGATGRDITELAQEVTSEVERLFGIRIETEVNIW